MKTAIIYALCEPGTRTVRYIGMTTKQLFGADAALNFPENK